MLPDQFPEILFSIGDIIMASAQSGTMGMRRFVFTESPRYIPVERQDLDYHTCFMCLRERVIDSKASHSSCPSCGEIVRSLHVAHGVIRKCSFSYKRVNHLREHLKRVQGNELSRLQGDVIDRVRRHIEFSHDLLKVTPLEIRAALKSVGLSQEYNHTISIWSIITGKPVPVITNEQEEVLVGLFLQVEEAWGSVKTGTRQNLLSYTLLLNQLCFQAGFHDLAYLFPLLKSRNKLVLQMEAWKDICDYLGWTYDPATFL